LEAALPSGNFAELPSNVHKAKAPFGFVFRGVCKMSEEGEDLFCAHRKQNSNRQTHTHRKQKSLAAATKERRAGSAPT
jgi:hypothetical protein